MKLFLSADIEGTTGITLWDETENGHSRYPYFQEQMSKEVNAACLGAMDGGCTEILVKDAHDSACNLIPAMLPFGTILLTPVFGSLYDRLGKGATLMIIGSAMLTLVHVLFALPVLNVWWFAILIMVILGIAFSLVPSAMWPSVPKIIPMKQLGSAYAIIFYIQNIGLSMVPVLIGKVIQKYAMVETAEGITYDYTIPMSIFALFGVISIVVALILKRADRTEGYNLEKPNMEK